MNGIAVFGIGYVGCVTAGCLARDGRRVVCVDIDADKVAEIGSGRATVPEPGLDALILGGVRSGRLSATTDAAEAIRGTDLAVVTVGTPSSRDGSVSAQAVERVVEAIGQACRGETRPYAVVIRSTLLPGILEERLAPILAESSGRGPAEGLILASNPEFLREGTAVRDYDHPPFILVGAPDAESARPVLWLHEVARTRAVTYVVDTRTAALVKYACNAYHALKVTFANEIGALARSLGADGHRTMELLCSDSKLNISPAYLRPGFAFGGSCLPKDLRALTRHAESSGLRMDLLPSILRSNDSHLQRAIDAIEETGHRRIGLAGLSFKFGTDDLRESPLVILAETLIGRGYDLRIYDPGVALGRLRGRNLAYVDRHMPHLAALLVDEPAELYQHASLLVLGTDAADTLGDREGYFGEVLDLRRDLALPEPAKALSVLGESP